MNIVADENLHDATVQLLRSARHDVLSISETAPQIDDADVLALAVRESRVLITQDKDFGALIYRRRLPPPPGLVLFRLAGIEADGVPYFMLGCIATLTALTEWRGNFTVIYRHGSRARPFP